MDPLEALLLGYVLIVVLLLLGSLTLFLTGNHRKLFRALLISALTGILIPAIIYFSFPYFVPIPPAPASVIDPSAPVLSQLITGVVQAFFGMANAIAYELNRAITAFFYGFLGMMLIFPISFVIPYKPPLSGSISQTI